MATFSRTGMNPSFASMERLQRYAWTGHSAIMGSVRRHWQDTDTVLAYFGKRRIEAMGQYEAFVRGGIEQDKRDRSWLEAAFSGAVVDGHRFFL
jgi:hypothetical protein